MSTDGSDLRWSEETTTAFGQEEIALQPKQCKGVPWVVTMTKCYQLHYKWLHHSPNDEIIVQANTYFEEFDESNYSEGVEKNWNCWM